jgi:hypothetical protein
LQIVDVLCDVSAPAPSLLLDQLTSIIGEVNFVPGGGRERPRRPTNGSPCSSSTRRAFAHRTTSSPARSPPEDDLGTHPREPRSGAIADLPLIASRSASGSPRSGSASGKFSAGRRDCLASGTAPSPMLRALPHGDIHLAMPRSRRGRYSRDSSGFHRARRRQPQLERPSKMLTGPRAWCSGQRDVPLARRHQDDLVVSDSKPMPSCPTRFATTMSQFLVCTLRRVFLFQILSFRPRTLLSAVRP